MLWMTWQATKINLVTTSISNRQQRCQQPARSAANSTGSESSDSSPAVDNMSDLCEVCTVQNRTPVAFVPCGHARFCTFCTDRLVAMGSACPVCRSRIDMVLRLFNWYVDCTRYSAARQRYFGVDTLKDVFENVASRKIIAYVKDIGFCNRI